VNREQKAATVAEIAEQIRESDAVFAVDYRGMSVPQAADLRAKLRDANATFRVVKNTLTERAADEADAAVLKSLLEGPTALTFVRGDVAAAAKAIADYQRTAQILPFKGGLMNGDALDAEQMVAIARLPSREVLNAQLVGLVASPITGLARTLNQLIAGVAIALSGVREKAESGEIQLGASTPAAEPAAQGGAGADAPAADEGGFGEETAPATETDQDAEAPEPPASPEEPAEGSEEATTETQEDSE
jgi:large subunit ribosomal protein L10